MLRIAARDAAREKKRAAEAPAAKRRRTSPALTLTERFLEHVFLEDLREVPGNASRDTIENFEKCLAVIPGIAGTTRGALVYQAAESDVGMHTVRWDWEDALRQYIAKTADNPDDFLAVTHVGYWDTYQKKGHACALLVLVRGDDATVAVADTGETSVAAHASGTRRYDGERSIVVTGRTDRKGACGILAFARNVSPAMSVPSDIHNARRVILAHCGVETPGARGAARGYVEQPDRFLAVRYIDAADNAIISHGQRGGTCTFHSILWLLGFADALALGRGDEHGAILERVNYIDREIKKCAFEQLLAGEHPSIAELVASDYGGCAWLDTKALRARLFAPAPQAASRLIVECEVVHAPSSAFSIGPVATSLAELAAWIERSGYAFDLLGSRAGLHATAAAFLYMARDLLVRPVDPRAAHADPAHVATIAKHVVFFGHASRLAWHQDTARGMSMRCVRYLAAMVGKGTAGTGATTSPGVVMPGKFTTSLPWVAAEYHALQEETAAVAHLLFHGDNIRGLAGLAATAATGAVADAGIMSANEFMAAWVTKSRANRAQASEAVRELKAELARGPVAPADRALGLLWAKPREKRRDELTGIIAGIDKELARAKELTLKAPQLAALAYIRSNAALAALNVAVVLLLVRDLHFETGAVHVVFGFDDAARVYVTEELALRGTSLGDMGRKMRESVTLFSPVDRTVSRESHARMAQNMEYMHDATRRRSSRGAEEPDLVLRLRYPRHTVDLDVPSLVRWADAGAFGGADAVGVIRHHVMPLSANGPTPAGLERLKLTLGTLVLVDDGSVRVRDLLNGVVAETEYVERGLTIFPGAYMTIAAHTGKLAEVLERQSQVHVSAKTSPDSSWALTRIDVRGGERGFWRDGMRFVFGAEGGGMARVHARMVAAGCRFDHWAVANGSSIRTGSATVANSDAGFAVYLPDRAPMPVFAGGSEWWDETYGAAVIPIGTPDDGVTAVVVVPGDRSRCSKSALFRSVEVGEPGPVRAYLDALPKAAFVVELDAPGTLPAATTGTDDLVALFVAYAYAGSRLGTRLMPPVASRAVHDGRAVTVPGAPSAKTHDVIRRVILGATCPLGRYAALVLVHKRTLGAGVADDLRCAAADVRAALVARVRAAHDDGAGPLHRARFSFLAEYGEPELRAVYDAQLRAVSDAKRAALEDAYGKRARDEWTTTLSATTGKFLRDDQRAMLAHIARTPWCVVQMQMGFGKSSVIVPMLVGAYVSAPAIRVVFVTQPPHLVAHAAATVGAFVAAHPYAGGVPVYAIGAADLRALLTEEDVFGAGMRQHKLVVVLSTAEMQCLVRDFCGIYAAHARIAHIADEVDAESDPMRCEVIIEGAETRPHYNATIAASVGTYYDAACELGAGESEASRAKVAALDAMCAGGVQAGTRLQRVFAAVRESLVHRTHYGMSDDDAQLIAVPFPYAGTPSKQKLFADEDVAMATLVASLQSDSNGIRRSDLMRLRVHVQERFKAGAQTILAAFGKDRAMMLRYYLKQIAMRELRVSPTETAVSFADVIGCADFLVGFSGTMGVPLAAPVVGPADPRSWCSGRDVRVLADIQSNETVAALIAGAWCVYVSGAPSATRAGKVIAAIVARSAASASPVCIVDGSGEFGAFPDDVLQLRQTWPDLEFFDAEGKLVPRHMAERTVRYYSHKNSRGRDSDMGIETTVYAIMSEKHSLYREIAQAIFRLRQLSLKGPSQTVVLVVATEGAARQGAFGAEVTQRLLANEKAHAEAAAAARAVQLAHAATPKQSTASFDRPVIYTDLAHVAKQAEREQEHVVEVHSQVESARDETKTLARGEEPACYEKLRDAGRNDAELTLANGATRTAISASLAALRIGMSPMLTIRELTGAALVRRAFAVDAGGVVIVMTTVEAWATYAPAAAACAYYTAGGDFMFGPGRAQPTSVLLGRFLCDETLGIEEELKLLRHIAKYDEAHMRTLLECLFSAQFLSEGSTLLLRELRTKTARAILLEQNPAALTEKVAMGDPTLAALLLPVITGLCAARGYV